MHAAHARFVFNLGLEQRKMWHTFKRDTFRVGYVTQARELAEARKEFPWLAEGSSVVQQGALRDLDRAYKNWWSNPAHFGAPSYRSRDRNQGFIVRDLAVHRLNRKWASVTVPKAGAVKFRLTRAWAEITAATSARVTLSPSGQWHVSLTTPPAFFERTTTGAVVGIDRGVAQTISTSDGTHASIPSLAGGEQGRFLALERGLARQVKGSARREATKRKLNRAEGPVAEPPHRLDRENHPQPWSGTLTSSPSRHCRPETWSKPRRRNRTPRTKVRSWPTVPAPRQDSTG